MVISKTIVYLTPLVACSNGAFASCDESGVRLVVSGGCVFHEAMSSKKVT